MEGWHPSLEGLCDELLGEEQLLSQRTESADAIRTPSDSSEDQQNQVQGLGTVSIWWAKLLRKHSTLTKSRADHNRPVTVLSGCTGAAAEIAVFKALGIPFVVLSASDPSLKCRAFVEANYPEHVPLHWFADIEDQYEGKACINHPSSAGCDACSVGSQGLDFAITGSPCHPFSVQRPDRFQGGIAEHAEFNTTMTSLLRWSKRFQPKVWVMEQVEGFDMPMTKNDKDPERTPLRMPGP
ncbi:unnamed protein product [Symbiodinium sp. CCMP2456]|nr:unnamed protein product [Symbiodinium sp. CCMP2456]